MAFLSIPNVAIRGISACVPSNVEENTDIEFYTPEEAQKVIASTGVERKHIVDDMTTGSDLSLKAAEKLLDELGWERDSVDIILYVTQMPDYQKYPTAFVIHDKLGLSESCMVLDLYHGCPGWVIGLSTISSLISHGSIKRGLLLTSDVSSRTNHRNDREKRPLFGDCGTATALEFSLGMGGVSPLLFETGARGKDGVALAKPYGGMRNPYTPETFNKEYALLHGEGETADDDSEMDGMSVFSFGITVPPKSIKRLCEKYDIDLNGVDKLVLHQANKFMLNKIAKKLKIDSAKVPMSLKDYGNTTSSSIPLTIVTQCREDYSTKKQKTLCCSFGTGLSWCTAYFETENIVCPEVLMY